MDSLLEKYANSFGIKIENTEENNNIKRETRYRVIYQILRGNKIIAITNSEDYKSFSDANNDAKSRVKIKKGDLLIVRALKIDYASIAIDTVLSGKKYVMKPIKITAMDTDELLDKLNSL